MANPAIFNLITYADAARKLGVSTRTFAAWVAGGRIPTVRLPVRVRRVRPADIEAFIAAAAAVASGGSGDPTSRRS